MNDKDMPSWFHYPQHFLRTVETGLAHLRPWRILEGQYSVSRRAGLKERFPTRDLVDVACWERGDLDRVVVIHDFADSGLGANCGF